MVTGVMTDIAESGEKTGTLAADLADRGDLSDARGGRMRRRGSNSRGLDPVWSDFGTTVCCVLVALETSRNTRSSR